MKKFTGFLKKHKKFLITALVLIVVVGTVAISLDLRVKHQWKKHPVEPYHYEFENNGDMDVMRKRIVETKMDPKLDVTDILKDINSDGTFKSIDYDSERTDDWPPIYHLKKTMQLQIAYNSKGNKHYKDPKVHKAVVNALNNWAENGYSCSWNWWYNQIAVGQYLPDTLLFGVEGLTKETQDKLLKNLRGTTLQTENLYYGAFSREVDSSGGNLTDKILSTMKIAVIENDGNTMKWLTHLLERELHPFPDYEKKAVNQIFRADCVGIKSDGSFQQHDQLIYFGGYGEVFATGVNTYLQFTKGTQYEPNKEALNLYADFILDSMQFLTRGGYRDLSASGRGISRRDSLKGIASQVKTAAETLVGFDNVERKDELNAMLKDRFLGKADGGATGHRYFYESDFQVMNNKNYMSTVRVSSEKTRIYEFLNGENPHAYYTGMGANFLYVKGDEYYNIPALLDWNKIPGTTTRQGFVPYYDEGFSYNTYGENNTVGGASNGKVGLNYVNLNDHGVTAKKAYFMFDNAVVSLGSNINSSEKEPLLTNINQTNLKGDVLLNGTEKLPLNKDVKGKYDFIYHNGIGYFTEDEIEASAKHVKGDWSTLNERLGKKIPTEGDVFTLSVPHKGENATYAYTALLNTTVKASKAYSENKTHLVLKNDESCQAVLDKENDILMAVFHDAGEITFNEKSSISVSKACVVIVENASSDKAVVTASAYNRKDAKVKITVNGSSVEAQLTKVPSKVSK